MNYKSFIRDVENWVARKALPYVAAGVIVGAGILGGSAIAKSSREYHAPKAKMVQHSRNIGKIAFVYDKDGKETYEDGPKGIVWRGTKYEKEIYLIDSDGRNLRRLTRKSGCVEDSGPVWSPDGKWIAFVSNRDNNEEIYVLDIDTKRMTNLTRNPAEDNDPAWSPDGKRLTFISTRDGNPEVYSMNADGTNQKRLTSNSLNDAYPRWLADGNRIIFASFGKNPSDDMHPETTYSEINIMNQDGSDQKELVYYDYGAVSEVLPSPSASIAAFIDANENLSIIDTNTGKVKTIIDWHTKLPTPTGYTELGPKVYIGEVRFSPDGKKLAFVVSGEGGEPDMLYTMNPDGKGIKTLTEGVGGFSWSPDGRRMVYNNYVFALYILDVSTKREKRIFKTGIKYVREYNAVEPIGELVDFAWQPMPKSVGK